MHHILHIYIQKEKGIFMIIYSLINLIHDLYFLDYVEATIIIFKRVKSSLLKLKKKKK